MRRLSGELRARQKKRNEEWGQELPAFDEARQGVFYMIRESQVVSTGTLQKIVSIESKPEKYEVDTAGDSPRGEDGEESNQRKTNRNFY